MNTCKVTLRVLIAHKLYIIIYLVLISIMMLTVSGSQLMGSRETTANTYESHRATVAIIDRDNNRGHIAEALRTYLEPDNDLTELTDRSETLQQAVASNWVDLIVIIPEGYADTFINSATSGNDMPAVETVTSYTSGVGTMASMSVNGFLFMTHAVLIGDNVTVSDEELYKMYTELAAGQTGNSAVSGQIKQESMQEMQEMQEDGPVHFEWPAETGDTIPDQNMLDTLPEGQLKGITQDDLAKATQQVQSLSSDTQINHEIAVDHSSERKEELNTSNVALAGFGGTMKTALYPIFLAMTVCTALVLGVFNAGETRKRLFASPQRSSVMGLQRMGTLCVFALIVVVVYCAAALVLMSVAGIDITQLPLAGVVMTVTSTCIYALMTVACGFLLGEFGFSDTMANGFANLFGLLIMFTSGISIPLDIMPSAMLAIGRMLPGWWYCVAIDNALGIDTLSGSGANVTGWMSSTGIVALYGVAFVCVGLAVGRIRRSRPVVAAPATTQLS